MATVYFLAIVIVVLMMIGICAVIPSARED
jgi:hypothetical protein